PGYLAEQLKSHPQFNDPNVKKCKNHSFISPLSNFNKRAHYNIIECDPLLNSSNIEYNHWNMIAKIIRDEYNKYDAFIIIHGTDTMDYTASALSFMLQHLSKTVILTGALINISETGDADGLANLLGALDIATHYVIPEVCIYCNYKLFRGNRVVRAETTGFDLFRSPNCELLGSVGVELKF